MNGEPRKTIFYRCPDDNFEFASMGNIIRCPKCGSLNLERYLGSGRWIKADAADVPENIRLVHIGELPNLKESRLC